MSRIKHFIPTLVVLVASAAMLAPAAQANGGHFPRFAPNEHVTRHRRHCPGGRQQSPVDPLHAARVPRRSQDRHERPDRDDVRRHRLGVPGDGSDRGRAHHDGRRRSADHPAPRTARHVDPGGPCSVGGGARSRPQRPPHEPRRLLRAAGLAHRPRPAARPVPAPGARDGAVADRPAVPGGGPGRRHAHRDPRPGAGRPRHPDRRGAAPRELLQPVRDRPRGRRHRQPGDGARPQRPPQPGAARRRPDRAPARRAGARRRVPALEHRRSRSR